jgi:hypothetical protein
MKAMAEQKEKNRNWLMNEKPLIRQGAKERSDRNSCNYSVRQSYAVRFSWR